MSRPHRDTAEQVRRLATPRNDPTHEVVRDADEDYLDPARAPDWPTLDPAAFHGPAGELVRAIDPHTEADPAAVLFQTLVGFGSAIGRTAFYQHESEHHYANEFLLLVGDTADGRKGTSWGHVRRTLAALDPAWAERIVGGLSSGEGLIHEVRDRGKDDPGVDDKRLFVVETEYGNVLKVLARQGNTLSGILRNAWEGNPLRTITKNSPDRCQAPHISLVGHITPGELRLNLSATESTNGLANRHLFVLVRRSKMLPDGGSLDPRDLAPVHQELTVAADFARRCGRIARDDDARDLWHQVYPRLSTGRPGLAGALTARALAHVTRLSLTYAMLDRSGWIQAEHLRAALACWEYAAASVLHVFGDSLGDPVADELLERLRETPTGLTRTEIRDHFQRHKSAREINRALDLLVQSGRVRVDRTPTKGRPAERWVAAT